MSDSSFDENAWAANRPQERLVWIDCEMTGLDIAKDVLVEIAVVVTEADLTPLDEGLDIVIRANLSANAYAASKSPTLP